MKRITVLGMVLGIVSILLFLRPLAGSGDWRGEWPRGPVYDREGRVLFRVRELFRVYYLGERLPPKLLSLWDHKVTGDGPPYLLAQGLTAEELEELRGIRGLVFEKYYQPEYTGGEAFEPVLGPLLRKHSSRKDSLRLTLSWEIQEELYEILKARKRFFESVGGAVIEIPSGEIYALVSLGNKEKLWPLELLFPVNFLPLKSSTDLLGEPTGIELPEAPGVFWPGGESLATPLQIARVVATQLCGIAPRFHMLKGEEISGGCQMEASELKREYNYFDDKKWLYVTFWPREYPRFVIVLAGQYHRKPKGPISLARIYRELGRYLPLVGSREKNSQGFPDLRGLTLRDALARIAVRGVKIRFQGFGRVVRQYPRPGTPWAKVKECKLYLEDET